MRQRSVFKAIRKLRKRIRKIERKEKNNSSYSANCDIGRTFKRDFCNRPRYDIIKKLQELSERKIFNSSPYPKRRKKSHRCRGICFVCKQEAFIQHHIIQIQHGGYDKLFNRIHLCEMCHYEVHPWMSYEFLQEQEPDIRSHMDSIQRERVPRYSAIVKSDKLGIKPSFRLSTH